MQRGLHLLGKLPVRTVCGISVRPQAVQLPLQLRHVVLQPRTALPLSIQRIKHLWKAGSHGYAVPLCKAGRYQFQVHVPAVGVGPLRQCKTGRLAGRDGDDGRR